MTTTAVLLAEAKAIRQKGQVSSDISQAVFDGWRLLPQLADALRETDSLATQAGIDAETQYQRALRAEARLAKVPEWAIRRFRSVTGDCVDAYCRLCEARWCTKDDGDAHPKGADCPARPMEPGT